MEDDLSMQIRAASEAILDISALTAGLDDDAARALLDWGLAGARIVVTNAFEKPDEKRYIGPRLRPCAGLYV